MLYNKLIYLFIYLLFNNCDPPLLVWSVRGNYLQIFIEVYKFGYMLTWA